MGITFDGLLGVHIVFALAWLATTFIGLRTILTIAKSPGKNSSMVNRAIMMQRLIAAAGGLTVLVGLGFFYYINFYRTSYATSSSGIPFVDAGAALGFIAFVLQMISGPRIRRSLKGSITTSPSAGSTTPDSMPKTMPPQSMTILPAVLLLVAFALMIAGSMM